MGNSKRFFVLANCRYYPFLLCFLFCCLLLMISIFSFQGAAGSVPLFGWVPLAQTRNARPYIRPLSPFDSVAVVVGSSGLEPPTSRLSGARSNRLSYEPVFGCLRCRFFAGSGRLLPFPCILPYALVEINRFELSTPCLQGRCSPN